MPSRKKTSEEENWISEEIIRWLRGIGCILCGHLNGSIHIHHVKTRGSGGEDKLNVVPLCAIHHAEIHTIGRNTFDKKYGVSLSDCAAMLWANGRNIIGDDK